MIWIRLLAALALGSLSIGCSATTQTDSREFVVVNARVWTADPDRAEATAFVVRDGRFAYVGDEAGARSHASADAATIDARGRRVLPGLIDSHLHLIDGGLQLSRINLRDVPDRQAFVKSVARHAAVLPKGQWMQGGRWSTESWRDPTPPRKEWIDEATSKHPVLLSRMDGHAALANSVALAIAGIDRSGPPDPPGGVIERDGVTGEPTGILKDAAISLVRRHIPPLTEAELDAGLAAAMKHANAHGITSVHTMSSYSHLAAFDRAREKGTLTLRIRHYISEDDWRAYLDRAKNHTEDAWVRVAGFKGYADGSLGSRTAYMQAPYADNPADKADWRGLLIERGESASLITLYADVLASGFAPAIHAIGDEAVSQELERLSTAKDDSMHSSRPTPPKSVKPRIEHAQHLLPDDISRFGKLGVIPSMQPLHKADDARYAEQAIGPERCKTSYAFRSLIDTGATVAFGSDWPVVSIDPFLGVRAAVTGLSLDRKLFVPEQNISVAEALTCYTRNAAIAANDEPELGIIREGYFADFVIVDFDPFAFDPAKLGEFRGETYVAGRRRS